MVYVFKYHVERAMIKINVNTCFFIIFCVYKNNKSDIINMSSKTTTTTTTDNNVDLDLAAMLNDGNPNDQKRVTDNGDHTNNNDNLFTMTHSNSTCDDCFHLQCQTVGKNFDFFKIWISVFQNNGAFGIILFSCAIVLFVIINISHVSYASSCYNAVSDDMKTEIDPDRIYAQEISKKTTKIITSYISSEFYFAFFFGMVLQSIISYGLALYVFEKNAILSRQHVY